MILRSLLATTFASFLALPMVAQACPMEKTKAVPLDVFYGPFQSCGGFSYQVGGVQIAAQAKGCPLFIIVTPAHEVAEASSLETKVQVTGTSPITMVTFACSTDWFLFIPVGSSCTLEQAVPIGTVQSLVTVPCNVPPPSDN